MIFGSAMAFRRMLRSSASSAVFAPGMARPRRFAPFVWSESAFPAPISSWSVMARSVARWNETSGHRQRRASFSPVRCPTTMFRSTSRSATCRRALRAVAPCAAPVFRLLLVATQSVRGDGDGHPGRHHRSRSHSRRSCAGRASLYRNGTRLRSRPRLRCLLRDPRQRAAMGAAGRARVRGPNGHGKRIAAIWMRLWRIWSRTDDAPAPYSLRHRCLSAACVWQRLEHVSPRTRPAGAGAHRPNRRRPTGAATVAFSYDGFPVWRPQPGARSSSIRRCSRCNGLGPGRIVRQLVRDWSPDIVHAQHINAMLVASHAARTIPLIVTVRDHWPICFYGTALAAAPARVAWSARVALQYTTRLR